MDHEETIIRAFVLSAKRERYLGFIANPKRRNRLLQELYHFQDFDPRVLVNIPTKAQEPLMIEKQLVNMGAPKMCYVLSTDSNIDRQTLPLSRVLQSIVGGGNHGTLLSCVPGRLGYFEGESPGERFILAHGAFR